MSRFELFVPGRPVPQGSKTAFISKSTGRPIVVDKDVRLPHWRSKVTAAAIEKQLEWMAIHPGSLFPIGDAIGISVDFVLERPKYHFGTGKNSGAVKASSPRHPATMPDIDKLLRAIFDALTDAQVWKDDGQVVWCQTRKLYGMVPGVHITLGRML